MEQIEVEQTYTRIVAGVLVQTGGLIYITSKNESMKNVTKQSELFPKDLPKKT